MFLLVCCSCAFEYFFFGGGEGGLLYFVHDLGQRTRNKETGELHNQFALLTTSLPCIKHTLYQITYFSADRSLLLVMGWN